MPTVKLLARTVGRLKPPAAGQTDYWDEDTPGFGLRVSAQGRRSWIVMYRHEGQKWRLTLGTWPALELAKAREDAKDALREVAHGRNPAAEKKARRRAETFRELADEYLERYAKVRKRTWKKDEQILRRDVLPEIGRLKAVDVRRADINRLLDKIVDRGAPVLANRTLEIVRKAFNYGIGRDLVQINPCAGITKPGVEQRRDRVLTEDEIRAVWSALDQETPAMAALFRLRLLTAQRGGEVSRMRWPDIDWDGSWWTLPPEFSKNGLAHRVPLSAQAKAIIKAFLEAKRDPVWVFPSPTADGPLIVVWKAASRIRRNSKVEFRPHDLRRTAASLMTGMGISRLTVSKLLNHVETGVTATYDRHSYDAEKRHALEAWGERLDEILAGQKVVDRKVVELRP